MDQTNFQHNMKNKVDKVTQDVKSKASKAVNDIVNSPTKEGEFTKTVEMVTAKVPSISYLSLALGSMAVSAGLAAFTRRKDLANFIGMWVPTFMLVGIYNKIVKVEGSDRMAH
jgi:hypothetical protein